MSWLKSMTSALAIIIRRVSASRGAAICASLAVLLATTFGFFSSSASSSSVACDIKRQFAYASVNPIYSSIILAINENDTAKAYVKLSKQAKSIDRKREFIFESIIHSNNSRSYVNQ